MGLLLLFLLTLRLISTALILLYDHSGHESLSLGTAVCFIGPFSSGVPVSAYRWRECSAVIVHCRENAGSKSSTVVTGLMDEMKSSPTNCSHEKSFNPLTPNDL
jgi:hypothetical protein